jgi:hypothetical protein
MALVGYVRRIIVAVKLAGPVETVVVGIQLNMGRVTLLHRVLCVLFGREILVNSHQLV